MLLSTSRLSAAAAAVLQGAQPPEPDALVLPPRSRWEPPLLPDVPAAAALSPLTAAVTVQTMRGARVDVRRQVVSRTADRVHVSLAGREEWLFVRDVVDARLANGYAVHHAAKTIVLHEDGDLRSWRGIRGWADVIMLGLSSELIAGTRAGRQTRVTAGIAFTRHEPIDDGAVLRELWWSAEQVLAERYTARTAAGPVHAMLNRLQPSVDAALLEPPTRRFPAYRVVDLAEWLER